MNDEKYDVFMEDYFDRLTRNFYQFKENYDFCVEIDYLNRFANLILNILRNLAEQENDKFLGMVYLESVEELYNTKDQFTCSFC